MGYEPKSSVRALGETPELSSVIGGCSIVPSLFILSMHRVSYDSILLLFAALNTAQKQQ